jgi:transposase
VAREGIRWSVLPKTFPPRSTVHRWMQQWNKNGVLRKALKVIIQYAEDKGRVGLGRSFIDGMFIRSKNGSDKVGKTKCGKGHKLMVVIGKKGMPISVDVTSAHHHEVTLVSSTLQKRLTRGLPKRLIGDRAYDSDKLDKTLSKKKIMMIAPHKRNRVNRTQDGRSLRSYKERWRVENFNNLIQRYRKVLVRYERHIENFVGYVFLATMMICARILGLQGCQRK